MLLRIHLQCMKKFTLSLALFAGLLISNCTSAHNTQHTTTDTTVTQQQPVIPGDFADPTIIRVGNVYYASGTSSEWAPHYPLFKSTDMLHWQQMGYVFPKTPDWALSSFWAPELFYRNNTYYVYYVARKKADGISCIGVATSTDIEKGFTDHGVILEFGKEAIDPFITEDNGKLYMTFKAYGLDNRPIELLGYQLSDDGLKVEGEPFFILRDDERIGLEGQCLIKRNNYFYLLYSAGGCCGRDCSYRVGVARSTSLKGPYIKYENNPILTENNEWKCTGHGTVVTAAGGKDFYMYHAYNKHDNVYTGRQGMLASITWNKETGWPSAQTINGLPLTGFRDDFTSDKIATAWQWDFRHTQPNTQLQKGNLQLNGTNTADNLTGTAITVRPAKGTYTITTEVMNSNAALKGLVIYGDANTSAGIGVKNDSVIVWSVKDKERRTEQSAVIRKQQPVYLKMNVEDGYKCRFFYSYDENNWQEIKTSNDYFNADFLAPWDRSFRPGVAQYVNMNEPAVFNFFALEYK